MPAHLFLDEFEQLPFAVVPFYDLIIDVGTVEAGYEFAGMFQFEIVFDVGSGFGIGGGGEGDAGNVRIAVGKDAELAVFGAEVVSPLADAVGFVYGKQADFCVVHETQEAFAAQAFGGGIEQFQAACVNFVCKGADGFGRGAAVDGGGADACGTGVGNLVVHQGDERGNDNGHAFAHQGWDLVAQGFAAACGHQHQCAFAARHGVHDFGLAAAKIGITECVLQDLLGAGHGVWCG